MLGIVGEIGIAKMDIGEWLRSLGLEQYEGAFRENEIEFDILPELTDQHLKDVGVKLGHRIKILGALREIAGGGSAAAQPAPRASPPSQDVAERRQLTVMFCDLVGSTALSEKIDPEDLREIIGAYHRCCAGLVEGNGGFVAKYMGDGVLVYFGYPEAREDDAERALQAALAIVGGVPKLQTAAGTPLHVRIGIATGTVVVGDLSGSGEAQERGIVGDTPNLAARLQAIAEPGSVVISDATRKLLGNLFELADLGLQSLKGIARPARAWAVLKANATESHFEALRSTASFVGREDELDSLLGRWSRAKTGEGRVVLLSGEPGMGKSRLTAALLERLADQPHAKLRYFCSPQHTASTLYPVIAQFERAAEINIDDSPIQKLDKLDSLLAGCKTLPDDAALIAELLSLSNDGRHPNLELNSQDRRQRTLKAVVSQYEALAQSNPLLILFEDAHWADATSLELLSRLIDRIPALHVLLLITFRPEFAPPWIGQPHVTSIAINRLSQREALALFDRIVDNKTLPEHIKQEIVDRADGVPLFVEEMAKSVLDAEEEGAAAGAQGAVLSFASAVPQSLQALLTARLDRLGEAKAVAQAGAAIGREFSHELLVLVTQEEPNRLTAALNRLVDAGLLFPRGAAPHQTYLFKHALVRDAAYAMLVRGPRRALHARIIEAIESRFADLAESQPGLLAHHCTEAGQFEKAARLWGKAGQRSLERSALVEAVEQISRALAQIALLTSTPALRREEITFQIGLASALMHVKGYAAPETTAALSRAQCMIEQAEAAGEPLDDPLQPFLVLYGFCAANYVAINGEALHDLSVRILARAEKLDASATLPRIIGHRVVGTSLVLVGDFTEAKGHHDKALALYQPAVHRRPAMRFGQDPAVMILSFRSIAQWALGYPDAASADVTNAIREARDRGQASSLLIALTYAAIIYSYCGNYTEASAVAAEAVNFADEKDLSFWKANGKVCQGCVLARFNHATEAVLVINSAAAALRSTGATLWTSYYLSYLAKAHADLGQFDDARRCIDEASAAIETTKEKWCESEIHRIAGEIALMSALPDLAEAQSCFDRALAIAKKQQARAWELRAVMSMSRMWCDQGQRQQAYDLLAPVYGRFTEGWETLDVKEAQTLLGELANGA